MRNVRNQTKNVGSQAKNVGSQTKNVGNQTKKTQINEDESDNLFEGCRAVMELLDNDKTIHRLFVRQAQTQGQGVRSEVTGSLRVILAKAKERGIIINLVSKQKLDEMSQTGKHQGVIALCPPHEYASVSDILRASKAKNQDPFLVILDKIIDPHNFGAIIRTATACGADGIIIPKRRSVGITAAVVRASAGAAGHMPVARVANIAQTMESLKTQGVWMVGADMDGQSIYSAPLKGPIALVVGNEGEGLSRLVKERCDFLVSLPMAGPMASLNASVAAGVALYEIVRQRGLTK